MIKNTSDEKVRRKFQPNYTLYICLIAACVAIRISPFSVGNANWDDIINEISIGVLGSVLATCFLDTAACKRKSKEYEEKNRRIFSAYMNSMYDLRYRVANKCMDVTASCSGKRSFEQWTMELADKLDEYDVDGSRNVLICSAIRQYVGNVRENLYVLKIQYVQLVDEGYIETDDFSQHLNLQINLCDEILYSSQIYGKGDFMFDRELIHLEGNWRTFFDKEKIKEKYNPNDACG